MFITFEWLFCPVHLVWKLVVPPALYIFYYGNYSSGWHICGFYPITTISIIITYIVNIFIIVFFTSHIWMLTSPWEFCLEIIIILSRGITITSAFRTDGWHIDGLYLMSILSLKPLTPLPLPSLTISCLQSLIFDTSSSHAQSNWK